jgi:hypothetical protein
MAAVAVDPFSFVNQKLLNLPEVPVRIVKGEQAVIHAAGHALENYSEQINAQVGVTLLVQGHVLVAEESDSLFHLLSDEVRLDDFQREGAVSIGVAVRAGARKSYQLFTEEKLTATLTHHPFHMIIHQKENKKNVVVQADLAFVISAPEQDRGCLAEILNSRAREKGERGLPREFRWVNLQDVWRVDEEVAKEYQKREEELRRINSAKSEEDLEGMCKRQLTPILKKAVFVDSDRGPIKICAAARMLLGKGRNILEKG